MLAYLPPLFFLAALMGSPVVGFLIFMLLGLLNAWQMWRQPQTSEAFHWTQADSWMALSFMSIFLFKLLSMTWSPSPTLALGNAVWHLYFLFWPLILLGLARCKSTQAAVDHGLAIGLIVSAGIATVLSIVKSGPDISALGNVGILAQLIMLLGSWNLLALTRPGTQPKTLRFLFGSAFICSWITLILTTRRLELLGFAVLSGTVILYRTWHRLTRQQILTLCMALISLAGILISLRWIRFVQGFGEVAQYFDNRANNMPYVPNSWGARLEIWRLGMTAILEHPLLGLSASARPYDIPGAPPAEIFGHRHFHSQLMQTLVEGGLLGLVVFAAALWYSSHKLIIHAWYDQRETALLATTLLASYLIEGTSSAALVYDKPNAVLIVASAWCWLQLRTPPGKTATHTME